MLNLSVSPDLPDGLMLNASTFVIEGIPTANQGNVTYTLLAQNEAGSDTLIINIRVIEPSPLVTALGNITGVKGSTIVTLVFENSGGEAENWTIAPALPDGLNFSLSNYSIYGTPHVVVPNGSWNLTLSNEVGSSTSPFNIVVVDIPPLVDFSVQSVSLRRGDLADGYVVSNTGGVAVNWTISPQLPDGLFFNESNGTVYGSPVNNSEPMVYNFTATNSGGVSSVLVTLEVLEPLPVFSYPETMFFVLNDNTTSFEPSIDETSGVITTYSIEPELPPGLEFNQTTGAITGQPLAQMAQTRYVITGTNEDGSTNITVQLEVEPPAGIAWDDIWSNPLYLVCGSFLLLLALLFLSWLRLILIPWLFENRTFEYNLKKTVVYIGETMLSREELFKRFGEVPDNLEAYKRGLDPVTRLELELFSIEPELPYGLEFNPETGVINGTPSERSRNTKYEIHAYIKKKRYKALVQIEVKAHNLVPEEGQVNQRDYTEAKNSVYQNAGINRQGHAAEASAEERPKTRREKKRAKAQAKQDKKDSKAQRAQQKRDKKLQKKERRQDGSPHKDSDSEASSDETARGAAERQDGGTNPAQRRTGQPVDDPEPEPPGPKFEGDLLSRKAQKAVDWDQEDYIKTKEAKEEENIEEVEEPEPEPVGPTLEGTQVDVPKGADSIELDDVSDLPESGSGWIGHPERGTRISWSGKSGNTLIGIEGLKKKIPAGSKMRPGTIKSDVPEPEPEPEPEQAQVLEPEPDEEEEPLSRRERRRRKKTENAGKPVPEQVASKNLEENGTDVSGDIKKGATTLELEDVSGLPTEGAAWIGSAERGMHVTWTGIKGTTLTGVKGIRRAVPKGSRIILEDAQEEEEEEVEKEPKFRKF